MSRRFLAFAPPDRLAFPGPRAERPPNILLIIPDQLRAQALGCMGNRDVKTPNIDRLAAEGILFRQTFANTPVCCPARAILVTGKYPHKNGMMANDLRLRETEPGLAKVLKEHGYSTGFIGKWHLDGGKRDPGYVPPGRAARGLPSGPPANAVTPTSTRSCSATRRSRSAPESSSRKCWPTLPWSSSCGNRDKPFFLTVSMDPPHDPYGAPEKYMKLYDPEKMTMRPNWKPGVTQAGRAQIAAYYAAITAVDEQVGRMMTVPERPRPGTEHHRTLHVRPRRHARLAGRPAQA